MAKNIGLHLSEDRREWTRGQFQICYVASNNFVNKKRFIFQQFKFNLDAPLSL